MTDAALIDVVIEVNARPIAARVEPRLLLVDFLRQHATIKSTRIACEEGACGACTVELNGRTVKSCLVLSVSADGGHVITVEGINQGRELSPLQQAFVSCNAMQCGYCTAGIITTAAALLAQKPNPSEAEVRAALDRNLCRCGSHNRIVRAVLRAAEEVKPA